MKFFYVMALMLFCLSSQLSYAQQKTIAVTGKVIDQSSPKKEGIPGATITLVGPNTVLGATDMNGNYRITVASDAQIKFSSVGYKSVVIKVAGRNLINVTLSEDADQLGEVTVTAGYQTKTQKLTTGSVVKISGAELQGQPTSDVLSLLQGKVAGLNIQNSTGAPGFRGSVSIRGLSNINVSGSGDQSFLTPTSPLFVIDGVPIDDNSSFSYGFQQAGPGVSPASQIPPEDIEDIQVLKDASATALYGSRGAYGVILITTKRGNSKVPVIRYSGAAFLNTVPTLRSVIGGKEERMLRINQILRYDTTLNHARNLINGTWFLSDSLNAYYNNSTNWQSYFYRPTYNQNHNINISGGDVAFNYKVAVGAYDEAGTQRGTGYSRYNVNVNMTYNPSRKFKIIGQFNNSIQKQQMGSGNGLFNTGVADGGSSSSLLPSPSLYSAVNQVLGAVSTDDNNKVLNTFAVLQLDYELINNLKVSTVLNYTNVSSTKDTYRPASINGNFAEYYAYNDRATKLYNRTSISYVHSINDAKGDPAHNFMLFGFTELNANNFKADAILNKRSVNDYIRGPFTNVPDYGESYGGTLNNFSDFRSIAFAGSFSYNYKQRYVVDFNYRTDGTSTNGPLAGFVKNPSLGLKWNFNEENFIKNNLGFIDYGSLRFSYGTNISPNGTIYDVYGKYIASNAYSGSPSVVIDRGRLPNLSLEPTKNTTLNMGFDIGLFKNKVSFSVENYYKQIDNIFREKAIANINSFANVTTVETSNVNYGWEFQFNVRPLSTNSPVKLSMFGTLAINREILAALPDRLPVLIQADGSAYQQDTYYQLGRNSLSNYLYNTRGVYANTGDVPIDPMTGLRYRVGGAGLPNFLRAGDPIFTDINGDYILDAYDKVVAGNSQPQITGGLGAQVQWKNFTLEVQTSFTLIRDVLNNALAAQFRNFNNPLVMSNLVPLSEYNYWGSAGAQATYSNPFDFTRAGIVNPYRYDQTLFQEDGTYFKLNSVKLYYNLNQRFTRKLGMNRVSVNVTGSNLGFLTNYSGPNPEAVTALGRDSSGGYPLSKSFALGLNIEF